MKRFQSSGIGPRRFGITAPHHLNNRIGYRGGIRS